MALDLERSIHSLVRPFNDFAQVTSHSAIGFTGLFRCNKASVQKRKEPVLETDDLRQMLGRLFAGWKSQFSCHLRDTLAKIRTPLQYLIRETVLHMA